MRKIGVFAAGFVMAAMMSAMGFAAQNSDAPAVRQQAKQPESLVDQAGSSQPAPGKTGLSKRNKAKRVLSKRNKAKIEEAEQRKLRQMQIDKERAADPQPK